MNKTIEERGKEASFQHKVNDWVIACFGEVIASDIIERNHRFIEEALELIQSTGATAHECHQLVDYVFSRPVGERNQELGGVMVTLAALANAIKLDMSNCGNIELERVWQKIEKIREKEANKPKHSPLPQTPTNTQVTTICAKELRGEAGCKEVCDECKRDDGWTRLVDLLATHGGSIVSTASLSPEWIEQAKASNRMYVNEDGLGFVWEPDIKGRPETVEEVEWFEKWYPLKIELPEKFKTLDWMHKLPSNSKQVK